MSKNITQIWDFVEPGLSRVWSVVPRVRSKTRDGAHGDIEVHLVLACATASEDEMADFLVATGRSGLLEEVPSVSSFAVGRMVVSCNSCIDPSVTLLIYAQRLGDRGRTKLV